MADGQPKSKFLAKFSPQKMEKAQRKEALSSAGEEGASFLTHGTMAGLNKATDGAVGKWWIDGILGVVATVVAIAAGRGTTRKIARGVAKGNGHAVLSRLIYTGTKKADNAKKVSGTDDEAEIGVKDVNDSEY